MIPELLGIQTNLPTWVWDAVVGGSISLIILRIFEDMKKKPLQPRVKTLVRLEDGVYQEITEETSAEEDENQEVSGDVAR